MATTSGEQLYVVYKYPRFPLRGLYGVSSEYISARIRHD